MSEGRGAKNRRCQPRPRAARAHFMSWSLRTIVVALVVLAAACGDRGGVAPSGAPEVQTIKPTTTSTPAASPTAVGPVRVPDLAGMSGRAAASELRAIGLRPVVHLVLGSACAPPGVLRQQPEAGRSVDARSRVSVEVNSAVGECGIDLPPATDELVRVARAFIEYARGGEVPSLSEDVELYLGSRLIESASAASLADPARWRICPPEGGYAAFVCPFSARDHVQRWPGRLAITSAAATHPCAHPADPPETWADLRRVTITPDEGLSCPSYWAVELYVDDCDRIRSVNLVRSEP